MSKDLFLTFDQYIKYLTSQVSTAILMRKASGDKVKYKVSLLETDNEDEFAKIQIHPYMDNEEQIMVQE